MIYTNALVNIIKKKEVIIRSVLLYHRASCPLSHVFHWGLLEHYKFSPSIFTITRLNKNVELTFSYHNF